MEKLRAFVSWISCLSWSVFCLGAISFQHEEHEEHEGKDKRFAFAIFVLPSVFFLFPEKDFSSCASCASWLRKHYQRIHNFFLVAALLPRDLRG